MVSVEAGNDLGVDPYPPKVRLIRRIDRYGRFLDALAHAQLSERCPCVGQGAMQELLDSTDALSVQPCSVSTGPRFTSASQRSCSCSGDIDQV